MIQVFFKPTFIRQINKLEEELIEEVFVRIELFKDEKNHKLLKVHKLQGKFSGRYSFSVNYKFRIAFRYETKTQVVFLDIGDHDIYK